MRAFVWTVLGLAACSYHPPPQVNAAAPAYRTDLAACQDTAEKNVSKQNAKRALTWFAAPVRRWGQIEDATSACMAEKGYGRLRWCTAEELAKGTRTGQTVATPAGLQCSDPPKPPAT